MSANMIGAPLGSVALDAVGGVLLWGETLATALLAAVLYATIRRHITARPDADPA